MNVNIKEQCIELCHSLSYLPQEERTQALGALAAQGCDISCPGPRIGQHHRICQLPNAPKTALMIDQKRAAALASMACGEV